MRTQVDDNASKDGVIVEGLADALMNHSDLVQKYFMKDAVTVDEHRITALHTALVNGGVFVYVPKNVVVEHPVQYVVLHDDENASFYNHVIIVTEESAEVTYVENYLSNASGEGNQLNIISEVIAGANPISHMAQWTIWIKALQVISFDVVLLKRMPQFGH